MRKAYSIYKGDISCHKIKMVNKGDSKRKRAYNFIV